jgi:hypothetical protein
MESNVEVFLIHREDKVTEMLLLNGQRNTLKAKQLVLSRGENSASYFAEAVARLNI